MSKNVGKSLKEELNTFIAGSIGGALGIMSIHPLDTIRVRLQTHETSHGFFVTLEDTLKKESFRGLYKGMTSPVLGEMFVSCFFFGFYSVIKEKFGEESFFKSLSAGSITGVIITSIVTPVELIKIRLQVNTDPVHHQNYKGLGKTIKEVISSKGGLYKGFNATLLREVPFTASYFVTYEYLKKFFHKKNSTFFDELKNSIISGGLTGMISWSIVYPADVLKSVIQAKPNHVNIFNEAERIYKKEGIKRFYKGFTPTLIRAFPESGVTFLGYEAVLHYLNK